MSGDVHLRLPGLELPGVRVTFGADYPERRERALTEGWGFAMELSAVMDILQAIETGTVDAATARDAQDEHPPMLLREVFVPQNVRENPHPSNSSTSPARSCDASPKANTSPPCRTFWSALSAAPRTA
jgi:hypothetical protein